MSIPIGLELYSVRNSMEKDMEKTLYEVKRFGYESVEYAGPLDDSSCKRLRAALDNEGLKSTSWHIPFTQLSEERIAETVDICEEINKRVVPNYENFSLNKSINVSSKLKGKTFSYMVDILIILFTNAFNHSGYIHALNVLDLSLKIEECADKLEIYMENNLSPSIELEELYDVINSMQEKLSECIKQREYYNYEGKSGYLKICKILEYNLSTQGYLEFGIDDNETTYFVKVSMPKKYLIDGGNSSANNIN